MRIATAIVAAGTTVAIGTVVIGTVVIGTAAAGTTPGVIVVGLGARATGVMSLDRTAETAGGTTVIVAGGGMTVMIVTGDEIEVNGDRLVRKTAATEGDQTARSAEGQAATTHAPTDGRESPSPSPSPSPRNRGRHRGGTTHIAVVIAEARVMRRAHGMDAADPPGTTVRVPTDPARRLIACRPTVLRDQSRLQ